MTDLKQMTFIRQSNIEQLFAGAALVNPVLAVRDCGWLDPDIIVHTGIKKLWRLILERVTAGMEYEKGLEIATQASIEADVYIASMDWVLNTTTTIVPNAYAQEIARRYFVSQQTTLMNRLANSLAGMDDIGARNIIEKMAAVQVGAGVKLPDGITVAEQFEAVVQSGNRSIETFIPKVDASMAGLERTTLTMLGARPSMGKTALMLQIARNVAQSGKRVTFFSLEMNAVSLWGRMACPQVGTTWRDVRAGKLNQADRERLIEAAYSLGMQYEDRLMIFDSPAQNTETIWRTVSQARPDLVMVDHLELISDKHESEVQRLGIITQRLKEIAKQYNCAVLCAVQLNRSLENRQDKRPVLSDMRDSGKIEQNADVVLMMYREDYYTPPNVKTERSKTEVWVRKFRDGPGNVLMVLDFNLREGWFE